MRVFEQSTLFFRDFGIALGSDEPRYGNIQKVKYRKEADRLRLLACISIG